MKKILPLFLVALVGLASCSKSGNDPQPVVKKADAITLLANWTFQSDTKVTAPKSGAASTTVTTPTGSTVRTVAYADNGIYTSTYNGATNTGAYTYANGVISIPYTSVNGPKVQVLTVSELTLARLVTVEQVEDTYNRYTTTSLFTR